MDAPAARRRRPRSRRRDRSIGDGAGAVVVGRATDEAHLILSTHIHADGTEAEILWTEYPASARNPRISAEAMAERRHYPVMNGKRVFKHAVTRMPAAIMEGMVANQLERASSDEAAHVDPDQTENESSWEHSRMARALSALCAGA